MRVPHLTIVNLHETPSVDLDIHKPTTLVTHDLPTATPTSSDRRLFTIRVQSEFTWIHIVSSGHSYTESATIELRGAHAHARLFHSISAGNSASIESSVLLTHAAAQTHSTFLAHHLAHDHASIRSTGDIHITHQAPGSTAEEDMRTLMMSETAHALPMPILRVDHNDVQSRHAAAAHGVLPHHLFALQTRGLSHHQALQLMSQGHVAPIVQELTPINAQLAETFTSMVALQTDLS